MTKQEFKEAANKILILDGATGSNLLKRGMPYGVCTELWVTEHPQVMKQLQEEYISQGSNIIYAPTFSGNRIKLKEYGLLERMEELNERLVEVSREASRGKAFVAGDITMTGAQLEPLGDLSFEELVDIYKEQIRLIVKAGVDLLVVETMMSLQETRAAVLAAREVCDLPVMATLSFQENKKTLYGVSAKAAAVVLQGLGVDAVGLNCSAGPDKMLEAVKELASYAVVPVIAKPNAGMPKLSKDHDTEYDMDAETFAAHMESLLNAGASILGGCCGSTPEFIGKVADMVKRQSTMPERNHENDRILLASEREVYEFAPGQKLSVGELIDFSVNEELVEEYREDVFDTAVDLAFDMEEDADILRICTSAQGVQEDQAALAVAEEVARNVNLPLMLASDSLDTISYVLYHYSGIMAIQWNHNLEEWETQIKSMAKSFGVPIVTIDNEIIYC